MGQLSETQRASLLLGLVLGLEDVQLVELLPELQVR